MSTYKHLLTGGDDFLLRFPLETVDDVLARVSGALQPGGQLSASLQGSVLQVLVTEGRPCQPKYFINFPEIFE